MTENNQIPSLSELQDQRQPIVNTYVFHQSQLSLIEKFAQWITRHIGSMGFFVIIFIWTISWLTWNTFGPSEHRFDPYPAFVLWLFISNMIQLMLLPLIMIGQNLDQRYANLRAEADLELNKKSEREIEAVLKHLEYQNGVLNELRERLAAIEGKK